MSTEYETINGANPYYMNINISSGNLEASKQFADAMWNAEKRQKEHMFKNIEDAKQRGCVCAISPDGWVDTNKKRFILNDPYFKTKSLENGDRVALAFMFEESPKTVDVEVIHIYNSILSEELKYYEYKHIYG